MCAVLILSMPFGNVLADEDVQNIDEIVVTGVKEEIKEKNAITALSDQG
jgi:hypothetical protein